MEIKETYLLAMREQAPRMLNELSRTGALQAHLNAKAAEAQQMFEYLTEGLPKYPDGKVEDINAGRCNEEQVRAALIEFPQCGQSDLGGGMIPQPPREIVEGDAIRAFAKVRFLAMAEELAADLRSRPATDIYGDDIGALSIWDEYCYESQIGPTFELTDAWSSLLDPLIANLIDRILHEEAVLLTMAEQWCVESDEPHERRSGPYSNPELIAQAVLLRLQRLANDSDWDAHYLDDDDFEDGDDEEPRCVLVAEPKPRSIMARMLSVWAKMRSY